MENIKYTWDASHEVKYNFMDDSENQKWDIEQSKKYLLEVVEYLMSDKGQPGLNNSNGDFVSWTEIQQYLVDDSLIEKINESWIVALGLDYEEFDSKIYYWEIREYILGAIKEQINIDIVYYDVLEIIKNALNTIVDGEDVDLGILYLINHCKTI